MAKHAKASPSKLALIEACPCFWSDPDKTNEAADEGTMLHEAYESGSVKGLEDDEQREAVEACLVYTEALHEPGDHQEIHAEMRVKCDLTYGTADRVILNSQTAHADIIDAKFGRVPIDDAEVNLQGQAYAHCLFEMYDWLNEVTVHFVQPRVYYVTKHTFTRDPGNEAIRSRIQAVLDSFNDENKQPTPSEKGCLYCDRKAECPALSGVAMQVATTTGGLPLPEVFEPGRLVEPTDRARAQVLAKILEDWASQVKKNNAAAAKEEGLEIPGFDLRERHGGFRVEEANEVLQAVSEKFDIPVESLMSAVTVSIPKLVEQVKLYRSGEDAKELKQEIINASGDAISERNSVVFLQRQRKMSEQEIWEGSA